MIKTTFDNIVNHLQQDLNIESDSLVWLHSGIIGMGLLEGGIDTITNAFEKVCYEGALAIPTFTYSWCNLEHFNPETSECPDVGAYAEKAWKDKRFIRNNNPNFSVAIMDNSRKKTIVNKLCDVSTGSSCFGKGSVFEKMWQISLDRPSYIILLGGAHNDVVFRTTFLHMAEELIGVPYRYLKYFFNPDNKNDQVGQYVRYLSKEEYQLQNNTDPPNNVTFPVNEKYHNLGKDIRNNGLLMEKKFAYSVTRMVKMDNFCNWLINKIDQDKMYLIN